MQLRKGNIKVPQTLNKRITPRQRAKIIDLKKWKQDKENKEKGVFDWDNLSLYDCERDLEIETIFMKTRMSLEEQVEEIDNLNIPDIERKPEYKKALVTAIQRTKLLKNRVIKEKINKDLKEHILGSINFFILNCEYLLIDIKLKK